MSSLPSSFLFPFKKLFPITWNKRRKKKKKAKERNKKQNPKTERRWTCTRHPIGQKLPFPDFQASHSIASSLSLINLCRGDYPFPLSQTAFINHVQDVWSLTILQHQQCFTEPGCWLWFFHPICLFFLYSPSPWWRSWKMRISLSNSALLSVPRLQQSWELEESLLLSNPLAPCVKDKEHHAWRWGWGCPAPRELRGAALGSIHREVSSLWTQGLGRKVLTFSSFSFRSFLIFSKKLWLNQQRHGWQTHNLGFQDWFVPQIYLLNRATHYTLSHDSVSCPWKSEN